MSVTSRLRALGRRRVAVGVGAVIFLVVLVVFAAAVGGVVAAIAIDAARVNAASAVTSTMRVCENPDNLPFSNVRGQGFENAIARLVAEELGRSVQYDWQPRSRDVVRRLMANECDVIMALPTSVEGVALTRAYYRLPNVLGSSLDRRVQTRFPDHVPLSFDMAIAVRRDETPLRDQIDAAIARRANDVRRILARFGVLPVALEGIDPERPGTYDASSL
jgi:ABC-type amino acid transport substrate-binding protein